MLNVRDRCYETNASFNVQDSRKVFHIVGGVSPEISFLPLAVQHRARLTKRIGHRSHETSDLWIFAALHRRTLWHLIFSKNAKWEIPGIASIRVHILSHGILPQSIQRVYDDFHDDRREKEGRNHARSRSNSRRLSEIVNSNYPGRSVFVFIDYAK